MVCEFFDKQENVAGIKSMLTLMLEKLMLHVELGQGRTRQKRGTWRHSAKAGKRPISRFSWLPAFTIWFQRLWIVHFRIGFRFIPFPFKR